MSRDGGWTIPGGLEFDQSRQVLTEDRFPGETVLKTGEVFIKQRGAFCRKAVNHPLRAAAALDHGAVAHVSEMPRDFHLGFAERRLNMADA